MSGRQAAALAVRPARTRDNARAQRARPVTALCSADRWWCAAETDVASNRRSLERSPFFLPLFFLVGSRDNRRVRSTRCDVLKTKPHTAERERTSERGHHPATLFLLLHLAIGWPEGEPDRSPADGGARFWGVTGMGGAAGWETVPKADALEFTPTWIVAGVCSLIVFISLAAERCLHYIGKTLKKKNQKALFEALLKVKEELMLLGFISLLLTVSQGVIQKTCIPPSWTNHMLPCKRAEARTVTAEALALGGRRLLSGSAPWSEHCQNKIRHWKQWEDEIQKNDAGTGSKKLTHVQQFEFIRERFNGVGKDSVMLSWMHSFVKQFYASVTKSDYTTMRLGFIMTHCRGSPKFDFHRYMVRALETDFKKVVGIRWYLWIFVVIFMLLNVNGWHTYFWISFIPLIMLLAVGTKLEHIIAQMAQEVAEKHSAIEGDLVVNPSDEHFWCARPRVILYLIHFILFQNAFEIALFFWMLTTYGFNSCIMDHVPFIVPRLVIGVIIQLLCSYSTLPLYAIVTQMGTFFKKEVFDEHIQQGLLGWAQKAKRRKESRDGADGGTAGSATHSSHYYSTDDTRYCIVVLHCFPTTQHCNHGGAPVQQLKLRRQNTSVMPLPTQHGHSYSSSCRLDPL
uniref:Uncharacterized protein n=1 Tax=Avena sativa TaxID=4498 RepID=A0ACD5WIL3_AVESA